MLKILLKNPVLGVGILFMIIFVLDASRRGVFKIHNDKLKAYSCNAVLVPLDRRKPDNWNTSCNANNLNIVIDLSKELSKIKELKMIKRAIYREMANSFTILAKASPQDNLERTDMIVIKIQSSKIHIHALSEGKFVIKFATMKHKTAILNHLKSTVTVKEFPKN